jgi:leader peptidase (prepilin peptidase) / N-methyltransferase
MIPLHLFALFSLVLGLVLGSFYTVCVHRYISGESIVWPGSHCPACNHGLSWWENIPLFSYLALKGRCRSCRVAISIRYPAIEVVSGVWALALALKFGPTLPWAVYMVFGGIFIVASFIDLELFILPDMLTLPGALLAFVSAVLFLELDWRTSLLGALFGAGSFLIIQQVYFLIKKVEGLGTGDIKLMLLIGALLGWHALPVMIFLAACTGLLGSIYFLRMDGSQGMRTAVPFGPFLCLGAMLYILSGERLLRLFLS